MRRIAAAPVFACIVQPCLYLAALTISGRGSKRAPLAGQIGNARCAEQKAIMMKKILREFIADESGATAIEYGLIAAGISLAIIAIVNGLGTNLKNKFTSINTSLK